MLSLKSLVGVTLLALFCSAPVIAGQSSEPTSPTRPNLLVILADDMGWNDISLHGSRTPTPNIDRLAASGVELRNLVVNSVCSPTRASFYTGCDAIRNGYGGEVGDRMNPAFHTIAQTFKAAGYQTGLFGKWHNGKPAGTNPWSPTPMQAGFDSFVGFYGGGTDFFNQKPQEKSPRNWYVNDQQSDEEQGYTTDLISGNAVKFIERNSGKPFFCMVTQAAPHEPFQATDALLTRVPDGVRGDIKLTEQTVRERNREFQRTRKTDDKTWEYGGFTEAERRVVYSAMMIGLDDGIGQILEALKRTGQDQNTIVLLFSDNGAMHFIRDGNLPLRAWKHNMYDGAIHVPGFLSFPKGGVAAGAKYESMIRGVDLYPTLAALAGVPIAPPATKDALDGVDHLPAILGKAKAPEVEWNGIFVYYGGYRDNQWKLIAKAGSSELYDLKKDPSELEDVSGKFADIAGRLRAKHDNWLRQHGANVNYTTPVVNGPLAAQPHGQVLAVQWSAPAQSQKSQLTIPLQRTARMKAYDLSSENYVCTPGDRLVYDMKIESMLPGQTAYISPLRGEPIYGGVNGTGVDTSGFQVSSAGKLPAPLNEWKRYVLGLGNSAAYDLSDLRLVVESKVKGEIRVLIDNLHILKPDGRVVPVWDGGKAPVGNSALVGSSIPLNPSRP
jgi:arylsulfatase A-like enzyme